MRRNMYRVTSFYKMLLLVSNFTFFMFLNTHFLPLLPASIGALLFNIRLDSEQLGQVFLTFIKLQMYDIRMSEMLLWKILHSS